MEVQVFRSALLASAFVFTGSSGYAETPAGTIASLGGRLASWDNFGAAPLWMDAKPTPEEARLMATVECGDLVAANGAAWRLIKAGERSFVAAWVAAQIARETKESDLFVAKVNGLAGLRIPSEIRAYLTYQARRATLRTATTQATAEASLRDLIVPRDDCRRYSDRCLPIAASICIETNSWPEFGRQVIESFQAANPKGPDVRLLLCRCYLNGSLYGHRSAIDGRPAVLGIAPDEPAPDRAANVCRQLLHENPRNTLAHYFLGRAMWLARRDTEAVGELQAAVSDPGLGEPFRTIAQRTVDDPKSRPAAIKIVD